jgi:ribosomal protein S18 acetylase RimI-like enzyme
MNIMEFDHVHFQRREYGRELKMEEKEHSRQEHLTGQRDMADSYPRSFVRRGKSLEMRFLAESSLSDLAALQSLVVSTLHEIEIFMPHDEEYLSRIFQTELSVLGVLAEEKLAAYSIIRYPGMGKDNLGRDLNLAEEDLKKLAHLQAIAVHPHFRGFGLQRELAAAHLQVLERSGYEHICCTVSPKNPVSLNNLLSYKNWPMTGAGMAATLDEAALSCLDIERQRELIQRGYDGYRVVQRGEKSEIFFWMIQ